MNIIDLPKDIAKKILNNVNEIKISERKKIWRKVHTELFKGYILEETGKLVMFRGHVEHAVEAHEDDTPRISLTYNFYCVPIRGQGGLATL